MTPFNPLVRAMLPSDLAQVMALQQRCYAPDFHEPQASFASKIAASPSSCWVAESGPELLAYLVALPVHGDALPHLHATSWHSPPTPEWLYLHDLAISPDARSTGLSHLLMGRANELASKTDLSEMGLIAVQDSVAFWRRQGFEVAGMPRRHISATKLGTFGSEAVFMLRPTPR